MHEVQLPPIRPRTYVAPASLQEALDLLARVGDSARVVAGGTDLMIEMDRRVGGDVDVLVDISRIEGLDRVEASNGQIRLGPLVTHNQCATSQIVIEGGLALAQACLEVGSPALRNRATVVGNIVTASPANDTISALRVLDAVLTIQSADGRREVALADFHTGVRRTVLERHELVTGVSFPALGADDRSLFVKLGLRRAQAISVVHAAFVTSLDGDGVVTDARIALGSVAPTVVRAEAAEACLIGESLSAESIAAAAQAATASVQPIDDLRAPATYRSDLIGVMVTRALQTLADDAQAVTFPADAPTLGGPNIAADGHRADCAENTPMRATVNGEVVEGQWSGTSLLDWIRDQAGLTGTKEGCAEGECGACTVHLDGVAALSCLVPAGRADGAQITTIEGLGANGLHPIQSAFIDCAAVQCGYCIPGFLMAGAALQAEDPQPDASAMKLGLAGNLCRCTGYYNIEAAFDAEVS